MQVCKAHEADHCKGCKAVAMQRPSSIPPICSITGTGHIGQCDV